MTIIKKYIEDLMYGRRKSAFIGPLLRVVSFVYGMAVLIRGGLFWLRILKKKKVPQPVISVGNLTLGGTGKTPAVINIAKILQKHHRRPVVISRGYGRRDESEVLAVTDGTRILADAANGGDEPLLIGSRLAGVPVVVGSNRFKAARFAHKQFGSDTVILDDGFQHVQLRRDLDIVLIDAADPIGSGKLFPAGTLREPLSGLRRAQVILITNSDAGPDLESVKRTVKRYTAARIFTSRHTASDMIDIMTGEVKSLHALRGSRVLAFAGIARPISFANMLRSLGAEIAAQTHYPDHYQYKKADLARLFQMAADEKISMIVTTEKDAMRLKDFRPERIWALRIELKIVENEEWEAVLLGSV